MKTLLSSSVSNLISHHDHVTLRSLDTSIPEEERDLVIQIVPPHAADAPAGKISAEAPVGRAVLHRKLGETIPVRALGQIILMKIVAVEKRSD